MDKRIQVLIILLISVLVIKAQEKADYKIPDYAKIRQTVEADIDGYNKLLDRFMAADTTLTFDELHYVYYGFPYAGNYNPMYTYEKLNAALAEPDPVKADSICSEALQECTVSLRALQYPLMLHRKSADPEVRKLEDSDVWRLSSIASVMFASGESDEEYPLYTIFIADEYALLEMLGLPKPAVQYSNGDKAVDTLVIRDENIPGGEFSIYFDMYPSREFFMSIFSDLPTPTNE